MKRFIALAVLATSGVSYAADRDIYDLQYLPKAGTTYGFSTLTFVEQKIEDEVGDSDIEGYQFAQTFGHAVSDKLSLQASLNYADITYDDDGGSEIDAAKGLSDPTVTARYRFMDETYRWDLFGGATISLGDAEVDFDGNKDNLQGGHSVFLGTQHGMKQADYQWAVTALLTHNLESTVDSYVSSFDNDAHNSLLLQGEILNKLAEKSLLRSNITLDFTEGYDADASGSTPPSTTYQVGTEYQHLMSADLLLRAGVDYFSVSTQSGQIDSYDGFNFRVGANYQF
jgi:hypothetical protein